MLKRVIKSRLIRLLERKGYSVEWRPPCLRDRGARMALETEIAVGYLSCRKERVQFIVIGANDGKRLDPVYPFAQRPGWAGLLLEPNPSAFAQLKRNYPDESRFKCVQGAIDSRRGTRTLFTFDEALAIEQASLLASFRREHLLNHKRWLELHLSERGWALDNFDNAIIETEVQCLTFDDLLERIPRPGEDVDLLVIDVEGFDAQVVQMIDFAKLLPSVIIYETMHCSPDEQELAASRLRRAGYRIAMNGYDSIAMHTAKLPMLTQAE
jgi:FkbM family methyltransferase